MSRRILTQVSKDTFRNGLTTVTRYTNLASCDPVAKVVRYTENPNRFFISVHHEHRNKGIGTQLLKIIDADMRSDNHSYMATMDNCSRTFYESHGFLKNDSPILNRLLYGVQSDVMYFKPLRKENDYTDWRTIFNAIP